MVEAHQQILAAPVDAHQSLPFERRGEIGGHRLAQATLANVGTLDKTAGQTGGQAAARDFDFGQFGHGSGSDSGAVACKSGRRLPRRENC